MQLVPQVEKQHINRPMTTDEVSELIMRGFDMLGQLVIVEQSGGVATMDNPDGKRVVNPCTVWVRYPHLMPAGHVAQVIVESESKDDLCQALFNVTPEELKAQMEKQQGE